MSKFSRGRASLLFLAVVIVAGITLIAFPDLLQSPIALLVMIGIVLASVPSALTDAWSFLHPEDTKSDPAIKQTKNSGTQVAGAVTDSELVGRDKIDQSISVGNINGSAGIAIGPNAQAHVNILPPAPLQAIHQIPSPPADFTGRQTELAELHEKALQRGAIISGFGMGGVGKSALAFKLADELQTHYPDAHLYIDLQGVSQKPVTPAEVLRRFIQAFKPTAQLPAEIEPLTTIYRSLLHNKKAIILLDNAQDAHQVEPLIPPPSCLLLITSRATFSLPGLYSKNLDILPPEDARELLLKICSRLGNTADKLAKLCGYLPLALRPLASTLVEQVDLTPEKLIERMGNVQEKLNLTGVQASFQLSYELLSKETGGVFRILSVFPADFDAQAEETICEDNSHIHLSELLKRGLVQFDADKRRYHLHDLVRDFADSNLSEAERYEAQKRHATFFADLLEQANQLYNKGGPLVIQGLTLFDSERLNIEHGQKWAIEESKTDKAATQLCSNYPDLGHGLLEIRLTPQAYINWLEAGIKAARSLDQKWTESWYLNILGIQFRHLGQLDRAITLHKQSLEIVRNNAPDRLLEGNILGNLGHIYHELGNPEKALQYHQQNLIIARELGNAHSEGNALGNIGNIYKAKGEFGLALKYHENALEIHRRIGDLQAEALDLGNIGNALDDLGEPRKAIEYYEKQLEIAHQIGDRISEGIALFNMGLALNKLGDLSKAIFQAEAALQIFEELKSSAVEETRKQLTEWRGENGAGSASNG